MKSRIRVLLSLVSGVALTLFAIHTSPTLAQWVTTSTPTRGLGVKKTALRLSKGNMLVMESDRGAAVIELTDFTEGTAAYRWRSYVTRGHVVEHGRGQLAERYVSTQTSPGRFQLADHDSDLEVAGPFPIKWSYADLQSGWVYLDQAQWRVRVVPSSAFDSYPLSN